MALKINDLSKEQLVILNISNGKHLVLSPPGTGKTELIAQKVLKALTTDNIPEEEIVCLTFTNRAARNMLARVRDHVPNSNVFIGNIHSFGIDFLKKNHLIPIGSAFIDDEDAFEIFEDACFATKNGYKYSDCVGKLRKYKLFIHGIKLQYNDSIFDCSPELIKVFEAYEAIKNNSLLLDYDDILILTLKSLLNNKTKLNYGQFSFLQVDEVQDINEIQWLILNNIQKQDATVILYGDIHQSIFGFLGANKKLLENFTKNYQKHSLSQNYRSNQEIISMLDTYLNFYFNSKNNFIINLNKINEGSASNNLFLLCDNTSKNINLVVNKLIEKQILGKINSAILFFKNQEVEDFYNKYGSKFRNVFKVSKFELLKRKFIKDIFAFLTVLHNPNERLSWTRLFKLFSIFTTLKESRNFINNMYANGLNPIDFLSIEFNGNIMLRNFKSCIENGRLILFDTETTGLDTQNDDLIQISAIELKNGKVGKTFNVYIKTNKDLTQSSKIHNITKEFLDINGINPEDALLQFSEFINGAPLVAHNLKFDKNILLSNIKKYKLTDKFNTPDKMFDSIDIIKRIFPELKSYKLERVIELLNLNVINSHNALDDVKALLSVVLGIQKEIDDKIEKSEIFIKENLEKLKKFHEKFAYHYNSTINNENPVSFRELINGFVELANIKDEKFDEINKLLNHMDINTRPNRIYTLLSNYLMFYKKCKAADLVTEDDEVFISTIHKAKGLEFDTVIIPNFNKNDSNSNIYITYENLLEQVKLLYVAMSRAKNKLIIISQNDMLLTQDNQTITIPFYKIFIPIHNLFNRNLDW